MSRPDLTLAPVSHRAYDKYSGEPDSPNFVPVSPLIERRRLSIWDEVDLKRACAALVRTRDDPSAAQAYLTVTDRARVATKHDKLSSFNANAPKLSMLEVTSRLQNRSARKQVPDPHVDATFESHRPTQTQRSRKSKPSFETTEQAALQDIRNRLDLRPKTSAAACIDYVGDDTSSSSNYTARTTPFTSAGITPGSTSKRFSELAGDLAVEGVDPMPPPPIPDLLRMDTEISVQGHSWLADELAKRRQREDQVHLERHDSGTHRPAYAIPYQPQSAPTHRPPSRSESIKNSIRDYIRPGLSKAESIHSRAASTSSTRSHIKSHISAIRQRFSRRGSASSAYSQDKGDEYFINASQVQFETLNKPLPPFPGLDTYVEPTPRPRHIADLFVRHKRADDSYDANRIVNEHGVEQVLSSEEITKRQDEISRAVLEKMTTGSIGSGGVTSPAERQSIQIKRDSSNGSREEAKLQSQSGSSLSRSLSIGEVLRDRQDRSCNPLQYSSNPQTSHAQPSHGSKERHRKNVRHTLPSLPRPSYKFGEIKVVSLAPTPPSDNRSTDQSRIETIEALRSPKSPWKKFFGKGKASKAAKINGF